MKIQPTSIYWYLQLKVSECECITQCRAHKSHVDYYNTSICMKTKRQNPFECECIRPVKVKNGSWLTPLHFLRQRTNARNCLQFFKRTGCSIKLNRQLDEGVNGYYRQRTIKLQPYILFNLRQISTNFFRPVFRPLIASFNLNGSLVAMAARKPHFHR